MPVGMSPQVKALIEDIEFMVENGAGWAEIVRRTGRSSNTLERTLDRWKRRDLYHEARAKDRKVI